jgi:hypothetical protein
MNALRLLVLVATAAGLAVAPAWADEHEQNAWPVMVRRFDAAGGVESWNAAGPLIFRQPAAVGGSAAGFRPFWVENRDAAGAFRAGYFLYPLFSYTVDENTYKWSVFELIRRTDRRAGAGAPDSAFAGRGEFEVWPFWFSRRTGDPELSYRALFPIAGTIRNKLGFERASWTLFPLYVQTEKRGAVTTSTPWPFVRVTRGAAHGFALWPLFSRLERPGISREAYYLWPFGYDRTRLPAPDAPAGTPPRHDVGALPFYARSTGPGYRDENFLWPFFGYTDRTQPNRYHENRYFWPFLVQGRGDDRYVNRWGPFYTHSIVKGYDKTWYGWPLVRHAQWTEAERDIAHDKTQLLYFLYWSETQRSVARPSAPPASLRHVWPLFSAWNDGAGRRQVQVLSPFEVFFPGNQKVRQVWTPLAALFRHDRRDEGVSRTSLLWNAVTWERRAPDAHREFHLGPLLGIQSDAGRKRIAIGNGLFGFQRGAGGGWRMFWLDFRRKPATTPPAR